MENHNLKNNTYFLESLDKSRQLFYQVFENINEKPKATLLITHGLGEHSEAYMNLIKQVCEKLPIRVLAWDMVGHGKSSGQRGYIGDINWLTEDFSNILKNAKKMFKTDPLFLLSHSLGGLIHLYSEQKNLIEPNTISGAILSNPCTALNFTPPKWKTLGADFLTKIAPRVTLGNEINPEQLSKDPSYLKEFKEDPLRHSKISPRLYLGMLDLMKQLNFRPSQNFKTLALLSPKDSVCDALKANSYLKSSSKVVFFEKSGHELLNDIEKQEAYKAIEDFLNEQV